MEDAQKLSSLKTVTAVVYALHAIWIIYRIVKGAMYLSENRPLSLP